jgi:predicted RND superfamily exporter protein
MERIAKFIVKIRYILFGLFIALTAVCVYLFFLVKTNYDMTKYLRDTSDSKIALSEMEKTFGEITVVDIVFISKEDLLVNKKKIENLDSVVLALFEDNSQYVKTNNYLLKVYISEGIYSDSTAKVIDEMQDLLTITPHYMSSTSVSFSFLQKAVNQDMVYIVLIGMAVLIIILFLTCSSWIDPLVLVIALGVGIVINLGTNIFLGEISFITRAICIVMQFALSIDFSVVFLHRYKSERALTESKVEALKNTLKAVIIPIGVSAITTIVGLIALTFMDFRIGLDIGLVLAKGVIIGLLTTFLFMPTLLLFFDKLIIKTAKKKRVRPEKKEGSKNRFLNFQVKTRIIIPVFIVAITVVCFIVQRNEEYSYKMTTSKDNSALIVTDKNYIENVFGKSNNFVIVMDENNPKELELINYLENYRYDGKKVFNNIQSIVKRRLNEPMDVETMSTYVDEYMHFKQLFVDAYANFPLIASIFPNASETSLELVISYFYNEMGKDPTTDSVTPLEFLSFMATDSSGHGKINDMVTSIKTTLKGLTFNLIPIDSIVDGIIDAPKVQASVDEYNDMAITAMSLLKNGTKVRILLNMNMDIASEDSFSVVRDLRVRIKEIHPGASIISETGFFVDIKQAFSKDMNLVNIITIVGIFLCVLLAFRNPVFPLILVTILQASTYIAAAISHSSFSSMFFLTYIIVMCIMMGACDDYAIVFADYYKEERTTKDKKASLKASFGKAIIPVITSGGILIITALIVGLASQVKIISDIGFLLALECSIAVILIIFVLPQVIYLCDKILLWDPVAAISRKIKQKKERKKETKDDKLQ